MCKVASAWQDVIRQVEQGSSKVLQAVDWPQSSPEDKNDQGDQRRDAEIPAENDSTREVRMSRLRCAGTLSLDMHLWIACMPCHKTKQGLSVPKQWLAQAAL